MILLLIMEKESQSTEDWPSDSMVSPDRRQVWGEILERKFMSVGRHIDHSDTCAILNLDAIGIPGEY
jgi:hypothetical protein